MRRLRVVLDADVLVDAQVRDIFLALAEAELIELRWNATLVDELRTILVDDMGRQSDAADRLCTAFRNAYPLGEVMIDRDLEVLAPGEALAAMVEILGAGPVAREFEQLTTVLDVQPAELLRRLRRIE